MKKILFSLFVLFVSINLSAQTAEDIIAASKKAMNYDAIKNFKSMVILGSQFMPAAGQDIEMTYKLKRPEKVYVEMKVMGMELIQAYNGKKGWMINPMSGSNSAKNVPEEAKEQFLQIYDFLESPLNKYGEEGYKYEYDSTETIEEKTYNKIKLTDKDGDIHQLYFDALTNWFYKLKTKIKNEEGEEKTVEIVYEEKTKVKGAILPQVIEIKIDGETGQVMRFDEYQIDVEIDDKIFEKP